MVAVVVVVVVVVVAVAVVRDVDVVGVVTQFDCRLLVLCLCDLLPRFCSGLRFSRAEVCGCVLVCVCVCVFVSKCSDGCILLGCWRAWLLKVGCLSAWALSGLVLELRFFGRWRKWLWARMAVLRRGLIVCVV